MQVTPEFMKNLIIRISFIVLLCDLLIACVAGVEPGTVVVEEREPWIIEADPLLIEERGIIVEGRGPVRRPIRPNLRGYRFR